MYTFTGFYMLCLFVIIYIPNRKNLLNYPKCRQEPITIVIPCYNEGKTIENTIKHCLNIDYPKNLIELIVVDDCSTDDSWKIINDYSKRYKIKVLKTKHNSGGPATPRNIGIKSAKSEYVLVIDSDSYPEKDSLNKMLGFMQKDPLVAAVTPSILTRPPTNFIQKIQHIEYDLVAFTRKMLDMVDSVYVTPGAFALYRKDAIIKVGLLNPKNMTEDIEIVWRLLSKGYKTKMSFAAKAYTETPSTIKMWWKQRNRWNIGGYQTLNKYKSLIFKRGMLGNFIIPYFASSLLLGIIGIMMFVYLFVKNTIIYSLLLKYSIYASAPIFSSSQLAISPSIISLLGIALLLFGLFMTFFSIGIIKNIETRKRNILNILFYMTVYSFIYPLITISSLIRMTKGDYQW